ncbi:hypothetical protein IQ249_01210 [Lusitaniella coriacea LEGE 07157]|uniref:asparagine synthase (glutamine-hydrolyzing) n=1 Tax=Lusitaniella coriacea LEGE 07157 TaxID=945747 RepID=A0A8J7DSP5_9CYAN|nr:asparagine synthase C-terminal domain-containing protein [Lusitaniella coriacea]MBE9114502.1 hypothetical protein [Lusitaniella coriacea LEGE 07157]
MNLRKNKMLDSHLVGFVVSKALDPAQIARRDKSLQQTLSHFPWLTNQKLEIGDTEIIFWGHPPLENCIHRTQNGDWLVLIGQPIDPISWTKIENALTEATSPQDFDFPFDGRFVLLLIRFNGKHWFVWNDWLGSILVFHTQMGSASIASTLESVVVDTVDYRSDRFCLPGIVSLLLNFVCVGNLTLFEGMTTLRADCMAAWTPQGFSLTQKNTVKPSDERWHEGWDELIDEMYELSRQAILEVVKTQSSWTLPLSGGLDSRLIAAVGAEAGVDYQSFTYGNAHSRDVMFARQVAEYLNIPWSRFEIPNDFLAQHNLMWADWFGSSRDFHGLYQIDFLEYLRTTSLNSVLLGYVGDALAGAHLQSMSKLHKENHPIAPYITGSIWSLNEIRTLFKKPIDEAIQQVSTTLEREMKSIDGSWFQSLMMLDLRQRQRLYISYQPIMYDYYLGVSTPFLNRAYANFCLSLPRTVLEDRRLLKEMYRRYYPNLASISGGCAKNEAMRMTDRYVMKRIIARKLPSKLRLGLFQEFADAPSAVNLGKVLKNSGDKSVPFSLKALHLLDSWFDCEKLRHLCKQSTTGQQAPYKKLSTLFPIAMRIAPFK